MKLQPDGVVVEPAARQPGPLDGVLAFLDVLFRRAALIVKGDDALSTAREVGHDKADARVQLERFGRLADGRRVKHYYVAESVGIATGFLIAALHRAGLATLTHTPSPMGFLNDILGRPRNEKPYMLLVVGHPTKDAMVPDIRRQPLGDRMSWR